MLGKADMVMRAYLPAGRQSSTRQKLSARSSMVEQLSYTQLVAGSNPAEPTGNFLLDYQEKI